MFTKFATARRPAQMAFTVLAMSILAACGGGGGGSGGGSGDGGFGSGPGGSGPGGGGAAPWAPTAPAPAPVQASDFDATGVKVGVLDSGFDADMVADHPAAVADALQEVLSPADAQPGSHGAIVSRVVGGEDIGDGFGQGAAHGFSLYQANLAAGVTPTNLEANLHGLATRGVKIVNNSWSFTTDPEFALPGGAETLPTSTTVTAFFPVLRQAVLNDGQLLVWANGNESQANPYLLAGAPYVDPSLEKGWITVAQVLADNTLASFSNACGIAANWCLSAEAPNDLAGTSFAAPVVTATAGQVAQAFPWMDNSALRQTILSTADDLGDEAIYGWGKVNPTRAVRGPALFDSRLTLGGDFQANFDVYRSQFFNDIAGDAGLVKNGTGSLVLWGKNTYAGGTTIAGGTVELYGSVATDVDIAAAGTLRSDGGVVGGTVYNDGTVRADGTGLRIKGDYNALTTGSTLQTQLGTTVAVDGTASLNDSRLVVIKPDGRYIVKDTETAVRAGAVAGEFGSVTGETGLLYDVTASYTPTTVDLTAERNSVSTTAAGLFKGHTARLAAADAVETAFQATDAKVAGAPSTVTDEFVRLAAKLQAVPTASALAASLDSLTGEIYASSQALTFQQSDAVNRALSNRVDQLSQAGAQTGLWVNMLGADGKLGDDGFTGANTHLFGGQIGVDHRVGRDGILGLALGWSDARANFDDYGGQSKSQSTGLSIYGRYGAEVGNYIAGRMGYDWIDTETKRDIYVDAPDRIKSDRDDQLTSLYAEIGHTFAISGARVTPFVGAEYSHLDRGAFSESGSAFALEADSKSYDQGAAQLGVRYQSAPLNWAGGTTTVTGYGAYRYANPTNLDFTAAFTGAPDAPFTVKGIGLQRHSGWLGLGAATSTDKNLTWFVNYDMQVGRGGVTNNVFSGGLRYAFE